MSPPPNHHLTLRQLRDRLAAATEQGMTLVEVVIAMVVLSIAIVGVLSGLTVLAASSLQANQRANVGAALRSAVEAVKNANYVACTTGTMLSSYQTAAQSITLPKLNGKAAVKTPAVVNVTGPNGSTSLIPSCSSDPGLQEVEVTVSSANNNISETLWVVKSSTQTP